MPYLRRRFEAAVTREVRVYLRGGDDGVTVTGGPRGKGVFLRVVAGEGSDTLDDAAGGGTRFSGSSPADEVVSGPGTHWDKRHYTPPPPNRRADWVPPRDSGHMMFVMPQIGYGSDFGVLAGASLNRTGYAFRRDPWSSQQSLKLLATTDGNLRGTYIGRFRFENSPVSLAVAAIGSGIEVSRFFGLGNETSFAGDERDYTIEQDRFGIEPALVWAIDPQTDLFLGILAKDNTTEPRDNPVFGGTPFYGEGHFSQVGLSSHFRFDGTDHLGLPRRGIFVTGGGTFYPPLGGVDEAFGDVRAQAQVYLATHGERAITLVLKGEGRRCSAPTPSSSRPSSGARRP